MRLLVLVHVYHTTNTSINNCLKQQLHHVKLLLTAIKKSRFNETLYGKNISKP